MVYLFTSRNGKHYGPVFRIAEFYSRTNRGINGRYSHRLFAVKPILVLPQKKDRRKKSFCRHHPERGTVMLVRLSRTRIPSKVHRIDYLWILLYGCYPNRRISGDEFPHEKGLHFDRARLIGTVGFSAISLVSGFLFEISFAFMFIISTIALLIALVFSIKLTDTEFIVEKSHKTDESGTSRTLTFLLIAATLGIMCVSFCGTFLPVLVTEKGFPENTVGICFAILSISEVPFLLFANRIIQKTGTIFLVATAILMMSIRLFLTPLAQTPVQLMLTNVFHGWNYIVIYFSIFNFIHYKMPSHKLDKSQTIFWMITQGVSFLIGNLGGGILVQYIGLTESYRLLSLLMFILFIPLFIWFLSDKNKKAIRV